MLVTTIPTLELSACTSLPSPIYIDAWHTTPSYPDTTISPGIIFSRFTWTPEWACSGALLGRYTP